jgi:hypothetical protein
MLSISLLPILFMLPSLRRAGVTSFHLPGVRRTNRLASSFLLSERRHVFSTMVDSEDDPITKKRKATQDPKKTTKFNHTRKEHQPNNKKGLDNPHAGSYANPAMRELFSVQLPDDPQQGDPTADASIKRSKRKVAFLLGYLGTNYSGFQINESQRTLQAEFELALYRCKLLDTRNFGYPTKYGWSTSGRTDKGVHAWYVRV